VAVGIFFVLQKCKTNPHLDFYFIQNPLSQTIQALVCDADTVRAVKFDYVSSIIEV
jgi:hypothetical protein